MMGGWGGGPGSIMPRGLPDLTRAGADGTSAATDLTWAWGRWADAASVPGTIRNRMQRQGSRHLKSELKITADQDTAWNAAAPR